MIRFEDGSTNDGGIVNAPERLHVERGARTGQPIIVAVDSTLLGPAVGGCRVKTYPSWPDGVADAVRLAAAMTEKSALSGLPHGGGKTVVALDPSITFDRRDLLHDIGDVVDSFGGGYSTGPDVGTSPDDMVVIRERTPHVFCLPEHAGGSGDSSPPTAAGVLASIDAVRRHVLSGRALADTSFAVVGLGHVGRLVADHLAAAGARVIASDIDPRKKASWGAEWLEPDDALLAAVDVVVPAAVGGILTPSTVVGLRCRAIVGPANNQLDHDDTAGLLHARGVVWAPDTVVSAGGAVAATSRELRGVSTVDADRLVAAIGDRVGALLAEADRRGLSPLRVAREQARGAMGQVNASSAIPT
jgi:leucine dehydrogenase